MADVPRTCFKIDASVKGSIFLQGDHVFVDWDLNDDSRSSEESGRVSDLIQTQKVAVFTTYLDGTGDGSDYRIVIGQSYVSFQGLWSDGKPIDAPSSYSVVACP